jgi:MFS transporter, DHA3 family, macrolide efflux protein
MAWWVLEESKDPALFAGLVALGVAGEIAARGTLGWFGDRFRRLSLIRLCYLVGVVCVAALATTAVSGTYSLWFITLTLVVLGVVNGIREPLQMTAIRDFLPEAQVAAGVRRRSVVNSSSALLGPAAGGVLIGAIGYQGTLVVNAAAIAAALIILTVGVRHPGGAEQPRSAEGWWRGTVRGLRALWQVVPERDLAMMTLVVNFALYPMFTVLVPETVYTAYNGRGWLIGVLEGAFAVGLFAGSLGLVARITERGGRSRTVASGFWLLGFSMVFTGLCAHAGNLSVVLLTAIAPVMLFLGGVGLTMVTINTGTLRSLASPQLYRNRIQAGAAFVSGLAMPLGALTGGLITQLAGGATAMAGLGVLIIVAAVTGMRRRALTDLLDLPVDQMAGAYERLYPRAFQESRTADGDTA